MMKPMVTAAAVALCAGAAMATPAGQITLFGQLYNIDRFDYSAEVEWSDPTFPIIDIPLIEVEGTVYLGGNRLLVTTDEMDFFGSLKNFWVEIELIEDVSGNPSGLQYVATRLTADPLNPLADLPYDVDAGGVTQNTGTTGLGRNGGFVGSNTEVEWANGFDASFTQVDATGSPCVPSEFCGFNTDPGGMWSVGDCEDICYVPPVDEFWIIDQDGPFHVGRFSTSGTLLGGFGIGVNTTPPTFTFGEPKGVTFLEDSPMFPAQWNGLGGVVMVALDNEGPGLQVFDLNGNMVGFEHLTDDGTPQGDSLIEQPGCINQLQLESCAADPVTGRLFLVNQGNQTACSFLWVLTPVFPCEGDIDNSGGVDVDDLNAILGAWNTNVGVGDPRDLANNDGIVNVDDLNVVLANWTCTS